MGRALRTDVGNEVYHVLNRANARTVLFKTQKEYKLFDTVLLEAKNKFNMRVLAYCIMPNHWHLVVYPKNDGDLSKFMNWLTLTHTQRYHAMSKTIGYGHLYQGRYKSFLCETDGHFIQLVRYVERNALRANLVQRAEEWKWGSAWVRLNGNSNQTKLLSEWPVRMPKDYIKLLNEPQTQKEVEAMRRSVLRGNPYGSETWATDMIKEHKLEVTIQKRGRPKKGS